MRVVEWLACKFFWRMCASDGVLSYTIEICFFAISGEVVEGFCEVVYKYKVMKFRAFISLKFLHF